MKELEDKITAWLRGYKDSISIPQINKKLFLLIFVLGCIIHSYRITHMINAADDIFVLMRGYGAGTTSGRWGLDFLGFRVNYKWIVGSFNLSVFDGILTLFFLSLSACIILELFNLQQSRLGKLFAVILVAYPVCSATLLYMFTAAYYGLSFFLAVLAVWGMKTGKKMYGLFSILCIAFSLGLYQAYFSVIATLCLLLVLDYFLNKGAEFKTGLRIGFYYVLIMCLGLGVYFAILNNRLQNLGAKLTTYQNIDSMGQIDFEKMPELLMKCYKYFLQLSTEVYHSINTISITRKGILVLFILCAIMELWIIIRQKKWSQRIIIALLTVLVPIAVNLIEIMCSGADIYVLMVYSTVFVFLLPIILWKSIQTENKIGRLMIRLFGFGMAAVFLTTALGYSWHANWNYVALDYMNRETESYMTTLVTRIKATDHYRDEYPVMFVGERSFSDQQFINPYSAYSEFYFRMHQQENLINAFSWKEALTAYTGFIFTAPSDQKYKEICASRVFEEMSCYPDDGSIAVIDGVIVVKIAD